MLDGDELNYEHGLYDLTVRYSLSAGLRKNDWSNFHETSWKGVACAKEEVITFWSGSRSDS